MYIVTAKEMYGIDHYTMQELGVEGKLLMENAGRAICLKLENLIEKTSRICVIAGSGNNGGDGFVIARTLLNNNYHVHVVQAVPDEKITGDALYHKNLYKNCGGTVTVIKEAEIIRELVSDANIIVDAMVGIGIRGKLREPLAGIVRFLNQTEKFVVSIDIPSGLPADEGLTDFTAVEADCTFIVGAPKTSAFLEHSASFYGEWEMVSIGFPPLALRKYSKRMLWNEGNFQESMPKRKLNSHKGDHGRGLVIGGSTEMPGSIAMSVKAALKAGSGLITAATTEKVIQMIAPVSMESTFLALSEKNGYLANHTFPVDSYDAIAIGIGMGRYEETRDLVRYVLEQAKCPVIIDADGIYHIKSDLSMIKKRSDPTIVTPHPGEMAMLLDISVPELLKEPFRYAAEFAGKYNVYVVLKGKYTIITAPDGRQAVNTTGNPGLAKGGSGDVLTGISLAMAMQDQSIFEALCNACFIHGKSADLLVANEHSFYDLLASDVIRGIADVYRTFS